MIQAIPNQPLAFVPKRITGGCYPIDPTECLLLNPGDSLVFDVLATCQSEELLTSPDFTDIDAWQVQGMTLEAGAACKPTGSQNASLTELTFVPTVGILYQLTIEVESFEQGVNDGYWGVVFAGLNTTISAAGTYTFNVLCTVEQQVVITAVNNHDNPRRPFYFSSCFSRISISERNSDYTITLENDGSSFSVTYADSPESFAFDGDHMIVNVPRDLFELEDGCYVAILDDGCDDTQLISQCVKLGDHDCTLRITACNTNDANNFSAEFRPFIRVYGKLTAPNYEYEVAEERQSSGNWNRPFADRQTFMELRLEGLGEFGHAFISTLPNWDHIYIDEAEFFTQIDKYEPGYSDVYDAFGPIGIRVTPKQELVRKVRCDEDNGGCAPPPNYWVQGTGPNEDYILLEETGERILLN